MKVRTRKKLTVNPFVSDAQRRACYAKDDPAWDCKEFDEKTPKLSARAKRKATRNARKSGGVGPNRLDPTQTTTMRRAFLRQVKGQFALLRGKVRKLVVDEDAFGLSSTTNGYLGLGATENAFCPGEGARDNSCSPTPESGGVFLHGTSKAQAARILKEGLKPSGGVGSGPNGSKYSFLVEPSEIKTAEDYASDQDETGGSVLRVTIPKDHRIEDVRGIDYGKHSLSKDPDSHPNDRAWRFKGHIPPEWISMHTTNKLTVNPFVSDAQHTATENRYRFKTSPEKIVAFQDWLRGQLGSGITSKTSESLWHRYAEAGYRKGQGRAFDDVNRSRRFSPGQGEFYTGSRDEFLRSSFGRPVNVEKIKLLAGRSFDDLENVTADMSTRMSRTLTDGLTQGMNPREVARLMDEDMDLAEGRAMLIATTELTRVHAEGQLSAMKDMGVAKVGAMVEFSTAGDDRVCPECEELEGKEFTLEDASGIIPVHPNCLPGDSLVLARSGITATSKRWFNGDLIVIRTAAGRVLSSTPSHPILTDGGWVASGRLDVGSNVVCDGGNEWEALADNHGKQVPTLIQEIAESFVNPSEVLTSEVPMSAPDFHGDGTAGEVAVIRSYRHLRYRENHSLDQQLFKRLFVFGREYIRGFCTGYRRFTKMLERLRHAPRSVVGSLSLLFSSGLIHPRPLDSFRLAPGSEGYTGQFEHPVYGSPRNTVPNRDSVARIPADVAFDNISGRKVSRTPDRGVVLSKNSNNNFDRDAELAGEISRGTTGPVFFDKIVSVSVEQFSGHVYNLETGKGFYAANGIITHNCRCSWLPAGFGDFDKEGED